MKRTIFILLLLLSASQFIYAQGGKPKAKSAPDNVTGHYTLRNSSAENTLDALLLPDGKVKVYLYASWIGSVPGAVNNGEIKTTLGLKNRVAVYESGQCKITIRFAGNRAIVKQTGSSIVCDFGLNVSADGTYSKRNSRKPKFDF